MRWIWLPAALLIFVAGCGGDNEPQPSPPQKTTGHLSVAEYRAIVSEYRKLRPLQQGSDDATRLARSRRACADLRKPRTQLIARVRADCNNAISFFIALRNLEQAATDCTSGSERDRIVCGRQRYARMEIAIRTTTAGGVAINAELKRRGIVGLCASSIGMTPSQVAAYRTAESAARDAVDAISVADAAGFGRAQDELADALDAGSLGDPLEGIVRGCRPPGLKPAKPRTTPRPAPKPKPKPKPLPKEPDDSGVKA